MFLLNRVFPLKVHCWGGLGSQFYALSMATDLSVRFKARRIVLVLHSSGVTRRESELDSFIPSNIVIQKIDDFSEINLSVISIKGKFKHHVILIIKNLFILTGFLSNANSQQEYNLIRPWVLAVRGHYTGVKISDNAYQMILTGLNLSAMVKNDFSQVVCVHYRLGDLLSLTQKSIIFPGQMVSKITEVVDKYQSPDLIVFSDSSDKAQELLRKYGLKMPASFKDSPTINVIRDCVNADFFIGSNSKISLWIVNLRCYLGKIDHHHIVGPVPISELMLE